MLRPIPVHLFVVVRDKLLVHVSSALGFSISLCSLTEWLHQADDASLSFDSVMKCVHVYSCSVAHKRPKSIWFFWTSECLVLLDGLKASWRSTDDVAVVNEKINSQRS